jgi:hypothetical protein
MSYLIKSQARVLSVPPSADVYKPLNLCQSGCPFRDVIGETKDISLLPCIFISHSGGTITVLSGLKSLARISCISCLEVHVCIRLYLSDNCSKNNVRK